MGKRQIGELQPFELVNTLIVADVATLPMSEPSIPLINGLIPLVALVLLQYFISLLTRKSIMFRKIINGKPVIVIDENGINYENLKALNMSVNDLQEALRNCQVSHFDMVQYAIIETNGKTSVIFKSSEEPPTREDLKLEVKPNSLPILIISEGKFVEENMKLAGLSNKEILNFISTEKLKEKDILFMNIDTNGKMYIQPKGKKYIIKKFPNFLGGKNW